MAAGGRRATYHLGGDVQNGPEIELAATLLEQVLKTLAEEVHDHNVVHFAVLGLLVTDEVEEGDVGLASQLVDQLALPEKHDVSLHLHSFLL